MVAARQSAEGIILVGQRNDTALPGALHKCLGLGVRRRLRLRVLETAGQRVLLHGTAAASTPDD